MKYIKTFETITSTSYATDKEFIQRLEDNITAILVDMLDDGYDINYKLTDYGGNIGNISIKSSNYKNAKTIDNYLELFHTLYDYLKSEHYDFYHINLYGWICDKKDNAISFAYKDWDFIEEHLLKNINTNLNRPLLNISFNINPINKPYKR